MTIKNSKYNYYASKGKTVEERVEEIKNSNKSTSSKEFMINLLTVEMPKLIKHKDNNDSEI